MLYTTYIDLHGAESSRSPRWNCSTCTCKFFFTNNCTLNFL